MVDGVSGKTKYELLEWDSNFFDFKVAKITDKKINKVELEKIINKLKKIHTKLVYWAASINNEDLSIIEKTNNAFLTGQKVIYVKNINTAHNSSNNRSSFKIEKYKENKPEQELIDLVIDGAEYSRFYVDPKITKKQYEELHKLWITNSVKDNDLFVSRDKNKIIGFVSLNQKNNRGNIDFIAVDKLFRGKGLATALLNQAHQWFSENKYKQVQAVTQKENDASCKMYEKIGYVIEKTENFYHFWI